MMRREMPAHQMRRARAHAPLRSALLQRVYQLRMVGETEVIVAAECEIGFAFDDDVRRLRCGHGATLAQQALRGTLVQRLSQ